jgi:hypothetical protein
MLGLSSATLVEQFDGLVGLIGQAGISDAFALDTASDRVIAKAMKRNPRSPVRKPASRKRRLLALRHDEDLEYLRSADTVTMKRLHNSMTNALRAVSKAAGLVVEEGSRSTSLFDALLRDYDGAKRHLLIELKTDASPAMCRLAVGQLLDYRRRLRERAAMDLAVLLPHRPSKDALAFFGYVGVRALWFNASMSRIDGDIQIPKR